MAGRVSISVLDPVLLLRMEGPTPPPFFVSDGCTWAPDEISGADLRPACHWHDWAYRRGGSEADRLRADRRFFRNLLVCGLSRRLAGVYYRRVRLCGWRGFRYSDASRPRRWWQFLGLFFSRYLRW